MSTDVDEVDPRFDHPDQDGTYPSRALPEMKTVQLTPPVVERNWYFNSATQALAAKDPDAAAVWAHLAVAEEMRQSREQDIDDAVKEAIGPMQEAAGELRKQAERAVGQLSLKEQQLTVAVECLEDCEELASKLPDPIIGDAEGNRKRLAIRLTKIKERIQEIKS